MIMSTRNYLNFQIKRTNEIRHKYILILIAYRGMRVVRIVSYVPYRDLITAMGTKRHFKLKRSGNLFALYIKISMPDDWQSFNNSV
jgi:hypothetical protein